MCGLLFLHQKSDQRMDLAVFRDALLSQSWRGPDAMEILVESAGQFILGHNRLSVIDPHPRANQPMRSACGRYLILYNGEIYNHLALRRRSPADYKTDSDTETILEGYIQHGTAIFKELDGMFAIVIVDLQNGSWTATRDPLGIKPLYMYRSKERMLFSSEPAVLAKLVNASVCEQSVQEWRLIRRPLPGHSFFTGVEEVLPGHYLTDSSESKAYWERTQQDGVFSAEEFEHLLAQSVRSHELSDCTNVSLLSGGLDSAIITALSSVRQTYTVGLKDNNEFDGAIQTANILGRKIACVKIDVDQLKETWRSLARLRGEPLSVPNEGLIHIVCRAMDADEKVVLTGEGADELLFGYDNIFRWAAGHTWEGTDRFLEQYGYASSVPATDRLTHYIESLQQDKTLISFTEDFFYDIHLTGLLRRMDFASMSASKEARVPFVTKTLVDYLYRRPFSLKLTNEHSKLPLRALGRKLGLESVLQRKKIGFSATLTANTSRRSEYAAFQAANLAALEWN